MKRIMALVVGTALLSANVGWAQVGSVGPYVRPYINPRPTVSPFVRMQGGVQGGLTYFGQIRPQLQNTQAIQQLQGNLLNLEQQQQATTYGLPQETIILPMTGHPTRFFDYSYFFNRVGAGSMSPIRGFGGAGGSTTPFAPTGTTGIIR